WLLMIKKKPDSATTRKPYRKVRDVGRRNFIRAFGLFGVSISFIGVTYRFISNNKIPEKRIVVTDNCVGCTGCASVCPTFAIEVVAGGIVASDDKCISCGYCQMACAVDGIRVFKPLESKV